MAAHCDGYRVLGLEDHAYGTPYDRGGKLWGLPHDGSILKRRSILKFRCGSDAGNPCAGGEPDQKPESFSTTIQESFRSLGR